MICPLPLLLNVFTIDISMDVILRSDTPDVMPFTITMFVFPRIIRQTSRWCPEAKLIRRNKAELRGIVLSDESSPSWGSVRALYPCKNGEFFESIKKFLFSRDTACFAIEVECLAEFTIYPWRFDDFAIVSFT